MTRRYASFRLFAALWSILLAPLVPMAQGDDLARALPDDTLGFIKAGPCDWLSDHLDADRLISLFQQYDVPPLAQAAKQISKNKPAINAAIDLLSRPMALVLERFEYDPSGPIPQFYLVIESGSAAETHAAAIGQIVRLLFPDQIVYRAEVEINGARIPHQGISEPDIAWGSHDGLVIVGIESLPFSAFSAAQAFRSNPLAASQRLQTSRRHARPSADPIFELFFDVTATREQILAMAEKHREDLPPQLMPALEATGLTNLHALYAAADAHDTGPRINVFFQADDAAPGLLSILKQRPLSEQDLRILPADAKYGWVWNLNLAATADRTLDIIEEIEPSARSQAEGLLAIASGFLGLSIKDELLASFGDTWAIYNAHSHASFMGNGVTLVAELREPDIIPALVDRVLAMANAQFAAQDVAVKLTKTQFTRDGITVHFIHGVGANLLPAWTIQDNYLILSQLPSTTHLAARALRHGPPLIETPDVAALRASALPKQVQSFSYVDAASWARSAYPFRTGVAGAAQHYFNTPAGAARHFAAYQSIDEYVAQVTPALGASTWTPDGYLATRAGSLPDPLGTGTSLAAVSIIATLVSILLPSLSRARELAKRAVSASNLRTIGQCCHIYANDQSGNFPPNLNAMLDHCGGSPELLNSPNDVSGAVSYIYISGQSTASDAKNILAYERPLSPDGTNVLFVEGSVSFLSTWDFEARLYDTYQRLDRADEVPEITWPESRSFFN